MFAEAGTTVVAHTKCRARLSQDQYVPSLDWKISAAPRTAWPVLTFNAPVAIDLGSQALELIPSRRRIPTEMSPFGYLQLMSWSRAT
jgi:hypothetical protein